MQRSNVDQKTAKITQATKAMTDITNMCQEQLEAQNSYFSKQVSQLKKEKSKDENMIMSL